MGFILGLALLATLWAAPVQAQIEPSAERQSQREAIVPEGTEGSLALGYSAAVRAGDMVYLSGVVAGVQPDENGALPKITDARMRESFDRAFRHIGRILEAAGASWDHVVDLTTYHTDMPAQIGILADVKSRYVVAPYPAWTAIDIDRLYPDGGLVEIKVTAYAPQEDLGEDSTGSE